MTDKFFALDDSTKTCKAYGNMDLAEKKHPSAHIFGLDDLKQFKLAELVEIHEANCAESEKGKTLKTKAKAIEAVTEALEALKVSGKPKAPKAAPATKKAKADKDTEAKPRGTKVDLTEVLVATAEGEEAIATGRATTWNILVTAANGKGITRADLIDKFIEEYAETYKGEKEVNASFANGYIRGGIKRGWLAVK